MGDSGSFVPMASASRAAFSALVFSLARRRFFISNSFSTARISAMRSTRDDSSSCKVIDDRTLSSLTVRAWAATAAFSASLRAFSALFSASDKASRAEARSAASPSSGSASSSIVSAAKTKAVRGVGRVIGPGQ